MKIKNPRLVASATGSNEYPLHRLPELALVGRSNVGKSSLINSLVKRKGFAAISSTPGKTRAINFYDLGPVCLVDLPGYGYAKVSQRMKESWREMIEEYLFHRYNLAAIIQIVDARHQPSQDDRQMWEWILEMEVPVLLVATKVDKISRGKRKPQQKLILKTLNCQQEFFTFFSAKTGDGKGEVMNFISSFQELKA